jgi:hypothetical protein
MTTTGTTTPVNNLWNIFAWEAADLAQVLGSFIPTATPEKDEAFDEFETTNRERS